MTLPKLASVIGCPVQERPCWRSRDFPNRGSHERWLADRARPGIQQHIHYEQSDECEQFASCFVGRNFLESQCPPKDAAERRHLLELAQGFGSRENVFGPGVSVLAQRSNCDRGNITLMGG